MGGVIFVVCRESVEALLVIGILYAWMNGRPDGTTGKRWLLAGVAAGVVLATLLALTLVGVTHFLGGGGRDWFELGMLLFASALIVQMVMWMREHGRALKSELHQRLETYASHRNWVSVFLLTMIAVSREGSEVVIFLYGTFIQITSIAGYLRFFSACLIGFAMAMAFFYALQLGNRFISWKWFFRITEIMLLFLGSALFLGALERLLNGPLAAVDLPAWVYSTMWDSSLVLSDSSVLGNLLASLFAYRSRPIGWDLISLCGYWALVLVFLRWQHSRHERQLARLKIGLDTP